MKKKILLGIVFLVAVMCLFAVTASAVEIEGVHYTLNDGENPTAEVSIDNQQQKLLKFLQPLTMRV